MLSDELSYERKLKEMLLALRIERAFGKDRILELYLNEIFLGNRSYGIASASLNYFDKSLDELTIGEAALLAGLPKAPSSYDPIHNPEAALQRRNYVLGRMLEDGYITADEAASARAEPLALHPRSAIQTAEADFFIEEVRRQLVSRLGEEGFYEGGLSVRVTVAAAAAGGGGPGPAPWPCQLRPTPGMARPARPDRPRRRRRGLVATPAGVRPGLRAGRLAARAWCCRPSPGGWSWASTTARSCGWMRTTSAWTQASAARGR